MTDLRQAAQMVLEALESGLAFDTHSDVLQNLRTALEQQQAEPVAVERWLWIFEEKNGDRYTHKNLFYTADEAAESARICGVKAVKKIDSSKVTQQAEPVLLQCTTCGTVYAEGVPPQVPVQEQAEPMGRADG